MPEPGRRVCVRRCLVRKQISLVSNFFLLKMFPSLLIVGMHMGIENAHGIQSLLNFFLRSTPQNTQYPA